jgi:hypothetical protein
VSFSLTTASVVDRLMSQNQDPYLSARIASRMSAELRLNPDAVPGMAETYREASVRLDEMARLPRAGVEDGR